jgi:hypothetical protein
MSIFEVIRRLSEMTGSNQERRKKLKTDHILPVFFDAFHLFTVPFKYNKTFRIFRGSRFLPSRALKNPHVKV